MTTEFQREQEERRRIIREGTTYSSFADAFVDEDRGGRFKAVNKTTVVGATDAPNYPQGPAWCADPTGVEPPLGFAIDEMPPCGEPHELRQSLEASIAKFASPLGVPFSTQGTTGDPTAAPSTNNLQADVERVGSSVLSDKGETEK